MDDRYSWDVVLRATQHYWSVRKQGCTDTYAGALMLDVSRAYAQLDTEEQLQVLLGVWLERQPIPSGVIAKMRRYLNGEV